MANIQPYEYQKRTNIEEHNDLVSKINEIIDVINQTNIETILPKINKLEADVSAINDTDNVQNTDIANLKEKDVQIDNRLGLNESNIDGISKSLVSDVVLMNGTTTGNMKARIGRADAPSIDSNDYNIQKPVSVELVQGSASAMVKAKITLSDGTVLISDDFMFTTEAIGTDVYISSFTFKNGNVAGTISADIGLSNGSTLEANNFVVPTDPNVISTISDLQSRMTAVESGAGGLTELKATVDGHTTAINELNTNVADLTTNKADVNNSDQTIVAGTVNATNINKGSVPVATVNDIPDISGKVNIAQGTENAGKVLGIGQDGNVTPIEIISKGINILKSDIVVTTPSSHYTISTAAKNKISYRNLDILFFNDVSVFAKLPVISNSESVTRVDKVPLIKPIVEQVLNGVILPDGNYTLKVSSWYNVKSNEIYSPLVISVTIEGGVITRPTDTETSNVFYVSRDYQDATSVPAILYSLEKN